MVDTELHVITEKSFLGNWVLLYFGYTSSPDVGPEELGVMAKATDILGLCYSYQLVNPFALIITDTV